MAKPIWALTVLSTLVAGIAFGFWWLTPVATSMTFLDQHGAVCLSIPLERGRLPVFTCAEFWARYGSHCGAAASEMGGVPAYRAGRAGQ